MNKTILQEDYTSLGGSYQLSLPLNFEFQIPKDDPVRLLHHFIGGIDLSSLYRTFSHAGRNRVQPRQMLGILLYSYMNGLYSSRRIESACRRDINFMYLLEGTAPPDHVTIARFRTAHFALCAKEILAHMTGFFGEVGAISWEQLFIDGTKMEGVPNKYKFVWKKSVQKNRAKLLVKISPLIEKIEQEMSLPAMQEKEIRISVLKKLRRKMKRRQKEQNISFVHGIGKRKSVFQRLFEELDDCLRKLKDYTWKLHICGKRNSFAKTDPDATFMRMKEDAMKNGQLKPAYNIQFACDAEFIVWAGAYQKTTDTPTLIPFLEDMRKHLDRTYPDIVADAGYESEENYAYLKEQGQCAYIKPTNYETSKKRSWKKDIGRQENMMYLQEDDAYLCANGKKISCIGTRSVKSKTGFISEKTCYACEDCSDCEYKSACIRGNNSKLPLEKRTKRFEISKAFGQARKECLERLKSPRGIELRVNRSIQAEGAFALVKADMNFRRFLTKGIDHIFAETVLVAMAHNLLKLHAKIQGKRLFQYVVPVRKVA